MTTESLDDVLRSLEYSLLARGRSGHTVRQYKNCATRFSQFIGGSPLSTATRGQVEQWLLSLRQDGAAPSTVYHYFTGLRTFYKWYSSRDGFTSPMAGISGPSVPEPEKRILTPDEIARVLAVLKAARRYRDCAIIALMYDTGMRASEVCGLRWQDVDWKESTVKLTDTKNGDIRIVPFSYAAGERLDYWRTKNKRRDLPWMFHGTRGRLTRSGLLQMIRKAFQEIGVEGIGPHTLRHTFATHFLDGSDAHVSDLMTIAGWKSEAMARRYTKEGKTRRAIKAHRENSPLARLG